MSSWAERVKAAISQPGWGSTVKTDETAVSRLLAVSAVSIGTEYPAPGQLVSVLAVPRPPVFEKPADWQALAVAYLAHHFNCPECIAAGRGRRYGLRCGTGAALWRDYSVA